MINRKYDVAYACEIKVERINEFSPINIFPGKIRSAEQESFGIKKQQIESLVGASSQFVASEPSTGKGDLHRLTELALPAQTTKSVSPMCEAMGCSLSADFEIELPVGDKMKYLLNVCKRCLPRFKPVSACRPVVGRRYRIGDQQYDRV